MLGMLLGFGTNFTFDWITPIWTAIRTLINIPVGHFAISTTSGYDTRDLKNLLKHYNISTWGVSYSNNGDLIYFTIHRENMYRTCDVLDYKGIAIAIKPYDTVIGKFISTIIDIVWGIISLLILAGLIAASIYLYFA